MDSSPLTLWWAFFLFVLAADVVLWVWGLFGGVGPDRRFQLLTSATLLLYVVLGMAFDWEIAAVIWFAGIWIFAIIAGLGEGAKERRA